LLIGFFFKVKDHPVLPLIRFYCRQNVCERLQDGITNFVMMKPALKRIASYFFLLVFLSPFVEKQLHDFVHSKDFHCVEKSGQHFHQYEHVCSFCDYHFQSTGEDQLKPVTPLPFRNSVLIEQPVRVFASSSWLHQHPSRGPPAIS
jgi:hypothetical protein